jgi:NAD(P)-dependent dehydrogenase (short-subunit alcohol dehydrogenase family)
MSAALFDLTGKVGLVTGANQGLGLGFATGMAKAGADVVIWGRRAERNEVAAAELRSYGGRVLAQTVDVTNEQRVIDGIDAAVAEMGRLDCVVVNAGLGAVPRPFHEISAAEYLLQLETAQHGAFFTLREATRHMVQRADAGDAGGSLIACSSLSVLLGIRERAAYAAARGAVLAMVRSIAVEYGGRGIRANLVAAGYFDTALGGRDPAHAKARAEQLRTRNPIPRAGTPADLEGITAYLMSDASAYHTGDLIRIDGGMAVTG